MYVCTSTSRCSTDNCRNRWVASTDASTESAWSRCAMSWLSVPTVSYRLGALRIRSMIRLRVTVSSQPRTEPSVLYSRSVWRQARIIVSWTTSSASWRSLSSFSAYASSAFP